MGESLRQCGQWCYDIVSRLGEQPSEYERGLIVDVFEAVRTLLAVRSYQATSVPDAVVQKAVEAGRMTASGMNAQPWNFIVVQNHDTLHQLGTLAPTGPYIAQAPLAIVVAIDKSPLALNIPDNLDVLAILPFGYPTQAVGQGKKQRKPLAEVAHREQFGQPFS